MSHDDYHTQIHELAENIHDEVGARVPDWVQVAAWARELARLSTGQKGGDGPD